MGVCGRIDEEGVIAAFRLPDAPDDVPLVIRLENLQRYPTVGSVLLQVGVDLLQIRCPIDVGLSRTQQLQIGSMNHQNLFHGAGGSASSMSMTGMPSRTG